MLLVEDTQGGPRDSAAERVAAVRAAVAARIEDIHHVAAADDGRDRVEAAGQRLAQDVEVRRDVLVLAGEPSTRASEPRLNLVRHEQHLAIAAEPGGGLQVALWRQHDAGLALDRLDEEGARV